MRIFGLGCGGSSDDFIQREHSGGLFFHHCTDLPSRCHQRNQANGRASGFDAFSGGQKPDQSAENLSPVPAKPLNYLSKPYCK
jgi:hypothetical protein